MKQRKIIKEVAQLLVLAITCFNGFFFSYAFIWFAFDLPENRWALLGIGLLALASIYGVYKWIGSTPLD